MTHATASAAPPAPPAALSRAAVIALVAALVLAVALLAGPRSGALLAIGLGFGLTLEGFRFGFTGPWRRMILERDASGLLAQLLAIGLSSPARRCRCWQPAGRSSRARMRRSGSRWWRRPSSLARRCS